MNYSLSKPDLKTEHQKGVLSTAWKRLVPLLKEEGGSMRIVFVAILITSATTLVIPLIIAHIVDTFIKNHDYQGIFFDAFLLLGIFVVGLISFYIQIKTLGGVGRRVLFNLRNKIFSKIEELPVAFFAQNKAGDLISRINNDTEKLNQFFAQALGQFINNLVLIVGTGILLLATNIKLGLVSLIPAALAIIVTKLLSSWIQKTNLKGLQSLGAMSGEIGESINNFKVIVAFNRLDYFRNKFKEANQINYEASVQSGIASNMLNPAYTLSSALAQLFVLSYGILLISGGHLSIGLLIGYLLFVNNFYNPLRQLAAVWSSLQLALAGLDRISDVLALQSNIITIPECETNGSDENILEFKNVHFGYSTGKEVLRDISFTLKVGKTYALVGPTGGGKTTTASLASRLFDPTSGTIYLSGRDIRTYEPEERVKKIGFILQEPFLFSGTIRDNILYGNEEYFHLTSLELEAHLEESGLATLLSRFSQGLDTPIVSGTDSISLGQKQLIAFIRAVLRKPEILILDEATANIDTVTEQLLEEILEKLPKTTTKIVIAHRLNTIESADEIFFVNAGVITPAGNMEHALELLLHDKRES